MLTAYIDCFSGVSGDMFLGALLDLGWPEEELMSLPKRLGLQGVDIDIQQVRRKGLRGLAVHISSKEAQPLRTMDHILPLIQGAELPEHVKNKTADVFSVLCTAEARAHGIPENKVHFHEIGAVDTILDVTGVIMGLNSLGITRITSSPLPVPRGWVDSAHGPLPLPAPACGELLKGIPVYGVPTDMELVTPTGAALLKILAHTFGHFPEMTIENVGYGAGSREIAHIPNLLRVWTGRAKDTSHEVVSEIRTNIDDMNPQWYRHLSKILFDAGALDVATGPLQMKKDRPGTELIVLTKPEMEEEISRLILEHSTTTGVRINRCHRFTNPRKTGLVKTRWGVIRAKLITKPSGRRVVAPEHDDCLRIAREKGLPLDVVYKEVAAAGEKVFEDVDGD